MVSFQFARYRRVPTASDTDNKGTIIIAAVIQSLLYPHFLYNQIKKAVRAINNPIDGRYANLSEAITLLKPITCIVGKIATKKISQPVNAARVHRSEITNSGINIQVLITPANIIGFAKLIISGNA